MLAATLAAASLTSFKQIWPDQGDWNTSGGMVASMSRMYLNKFDPTKGIETQKSLIVPPLLVTFDLNKFDPIKGTNEIW